jgi:hypothetical protein
MGHSQNSRGESLVAQGGLKRCAGWGEARSTYMAPHSHRWAAGAGGGWLEGSTQEEAEEEGGGGWGRYAGNSGSPGTRGLCRGRPAAVISPPPQRKRRTEGDWNPQQAFARTKSHADAGYGCRSREQTESPPRRCCERQQAASAQPASGSRPKPPRTYGAG